jgi:AraC family transcriptional regulator of adaptative response/methylated-DNA-[protein]-cysteine methyltransferase
MAPVYPARPLEVAVFGPGGRTAASGRGRCAPAPRATLGGEEENPMIAWTIRETSLGSLLVAATPRGVCFSAFGEDARALEAALAAEFPFASLRRDDAGLAAWSDLLVAGVDGDGARGEVPLDVAGSRFQRRVWDALRAIPRGQTRAYGEVAAALGAPRAARAVAQACAQNRVPVAIPCHRVVPRAGGTGGYAFGAWRKRALLAREAAAVSARAPAATPAPR